MVSRKVPLQRYDATRQCWRDAEASAQPVDRDYVTLTTFNIWFDERHAAERYQAIADLLARDSPDLMVFQEVTTPALDVFLAQPWIREHYLSAAVVGGSRGNYGMLLLSRLPIARVSYSRLPTRMARGFLRADVPVNDATTVVCCVHLDSGRQSVRVRARQIHRIFRTLRRVDDAVVLGDFNMRDAENPRLDGPFRDLWPVLRPGEAGFTEDTTINLTRFDMKNKHRHVRFDRVLLKGLRWTPEEIELLGTEPISTALPRVFPSDHFGVRCRLARGSQTVAPARRSWLRRLF